MPTRSRTSQESTAHGRATPSQRSGRRGGARIGRGVAGALLLLSTACSGASDPRFDADDLSNQSCQGMKEALAQVEQAQREVAAGDIDAPAAAAVYAQAREPLEQVGDAADPDLARQVTDLVTALGVFRVGADVGSLDEEHAETVRATLDAVVTTCGADVS